MQRYHQEGTVGKGAFGVVTKCTQINTGETVAVKRMLQRFQTWEECLGLREILSLRRLQHTNVIKLKEVVRENTELFLIFEFMEGSIYNIQKHRTEQVGQGSGGVFSEKEIRSIMAQVLLGLAAVHKGGFMHRDLKPENLLVRGDYVKVADFGLAKEIRSRPPFTEYVSTRWYRAPEIVLRSTHYNSPIDIWAAGVMFAEFYLNRALLPGSSDSDQLFKICSVLGSPSMSEWDEGYQLARRLNVRFPSVAAPPLRQQIPNASADAINLIESMLKFNPSDRPTASQCLQHPFFCQHLGGDLSSHYQGIATGTPQNPFQLASGSSQLPGSNSVTPGNSTPVGSRPSSLPPPPSVIGASAHRQSPLGNPTMNNNNQSTGGGGGGGGGGQFGGGFSSQPGQGRLSNSPISSFAPHQQHQPQQQQQQQQQSTHHGHARSSSGSGFGAGGSGYTSMFGSGGGNSSVSGSTTPVSSFSTSYNTNANNNNSSTTSSTGGGGGSGLGVRSSSVTQSSIPSQFGGPLGSSTSSNSSHNNSSSNHAHGGGGGGGGTSTLHGRRAPSPLGNNSNFGSGSGLSSGGAGGFGMGGGGGSIHNNSSVPRGGSGLGSLSGLSSLGNTQPTTGSGGLGGGFGGNNSSSISKNHHSSVDDQY